jgi:hypothetical protein
MDLDPVAQKVRNIETEIGQRILPDLMSLQMEIDRLDDFEMRLRQVECGKRG